MSAPPIAEAPLLLQDLADAVSTARVLEAAAELGLIGSLAGRPQGHHRTRRHLRDR